MNGKKLTVILMAALSAGPILAAANNAPTDDPVVVKESVDKAPARFLACRSTVLVECLTDSTSTALSQTCDVVKYQGFTYWPMVFRDNRYAIVASGRVDDSNQAKNVYVPGTRYIWKVDVNKDNHTVTFFGQGKTSASISWEQLRKATSVIDCPPEAAPKD